MEVKINLLFFDHFEQTPEEFQRQFLHSLLKIEAAEKLQSVEGIKPIGKSKIHFCLQIDKSKIGLKLVTDTALVVCFIHNQFTGY